MSPVFSRLSGVSFDLRHEQSVGFAHPHFSLNERAPTGYVQHTENNIVAQSNRLEQIGHLVTHYTELLLAEWTHGFHLAKSESLDVSAARTDATKRCGRGTHSHHHGQVSEKNTELDRGS